MFSVFIILVVNILLLSFVFCYLLTFFIGPPFVVTPSSRVKQMIDAAKLTKDDVVIDLGSGDGRLLLAALSQGVEKAIGWEINPYLVFWTRVLARTQGVSKKTTVHLKMMESADISEATVIFCYLMPPQMAALEKKVMQHKKPLRIISYVFFFPNLQPVKTIGKIRVYHIN